MCDQCDKAWTESNRRNRFTGASSGAVKCFFVGTRFHVFRVGNRMRQVKMLTRGSKTAAEEVVRRFESCADLASPDKRESIPLVTDVQVCVNSRRNSL